MQELYGASAVPRFEHQFGQLQRSLSLTSQNAITAGTTTIITTKTTKPTNATNNTK
jgi:hypothetical protein